MNIQTINHNGLSFVKISKLQELEIKYLIQNYQVNQLNIDDYLSKHQVPTIEINQKYILVVLDFPFLDSPKTNGKQTENNINSKNQELNNNHFKEKKTFKEFITDSINLSMTLPHLELLSPFNKTRIRTGHVNFFIGDEFLVVLHDERTPIINTLFEECQKTLKKREELMGNSSQYLFYKIIDALVDNSFNIMQSITQTIDQIDRHILEPNAPTSVVEDISVTRRNIVVFKTMVKSALHIFTDLENGKYKNLNHNMNFFWGNIKDHLQKIWDRLEDSSELINGIATSHESLLTARTNEIIKVLTMFTAILLPLTLLASIYGMNIVGLPYAESSNALSLILLIMADIAFLMVIIFKLKKWL